MKKILISLTIICLFLAIKGIWAEESMEYLETAKAVPRGKAPGLKIKLLSDSNNIKKYVLVFAPGDEVLSGIADFANKYDVKDAHFTAIGALKKAISGWYDASKKAYKLNHINQQVELVSLIGNISLLNGKPVVHAHFAAGLPDGKVEGGHLIEAYTFPTVELFITVEPTPIYKLLDQHTGLNLIDPNFVSSKANSK
jgi:predicted DNA-binding protein with PD1-like motif